MPRFGAWRLQHVEGGRLHANRSAKALFAAARGEADGPRSACSAARNTFYAVRGLDSRRRHNAGRQADGTRPRVRHDEPRTKQSRGEKKQRWLSALESGPPALVKVFQRACI